MYGEDRHITGFSEEAASGEDNISVKNRIPSGVISSSGVMEEYNKGGHSARGMGWGWKWRL